MRNLSGQNKRNSRCNIAGLIRVGMHDTTLAGKNGGMK